MFFELSKILQFLISPLIWILILLLTALIIKNRKKSVRLVISALCMFFFFSNSFIVDEFIRMTETPMVYDEQLGYYDAGIVLGGGMVTIDRTGDRLIFQDNTDRVLQAIHLYKAGRIKKILLSSGSGSMVFKDMLEGALLKRFLIDDGIPQKDILVDSISRNTYENAVNSAQILRDSLPGGKYLLITSALHMSRARACFIKQGIIVDIYPVSKRTGQRRYDIGFLLVPNVENLEMWENLLHEWFGFIVYKMKGYI
jgi:uncharacterized SAM-binding protein YcdF (DUF218 family)